MSRNARTQKTERPQTAPITPCHAVYTLIWTVNVYANIYLFSLSTQVDSAIAVVQEDSSTVRLDKEILANAIPMMYIFP